MIDTKVIRASAHEATKGLDRSVALATGQIELIGRHGQSIGPFICATVELRVDDMRGALVAARTDVPALCDEVDRLRAVLRVTTDTLDRLVDSNDDINDMATAAVEYTKAIAVIVAARAALDGGA